MLASAVRPSTRARAARVSLVVGSLLVLINQWQALFGPQSLDLLKVGLTYMVPWGVVTWTSVMRDRELVLEKAKEKAAASPEHRPCP